MQRASFLVLLLATLAGGCKLSSGLEAGDQSAILQTERRLFVVAFTPVPNPIPFDQLFELDVEISDPFGAPVFDADLAVIATLPAQGIGMLGEPVVIERGYGSFLVQGMRFHEQGTWLLELWIDAAGAFDRAVVEIACCAD